MQTLTIPTLDDLGALVAALPPEAQDLSTGVYARPNEDGTHMLFVPEALFATAQALIADIDAVKRQQALKRLRAERDRRLTACDWAVLPDAPLTSVQRQAWTSYRQALRDLPETAADPASPEWPSLPTSELP